MASPSPPRLDAPHPFQSALLLTALNTNASVDRAVLRAAGVRQVRVAATGVDAARYLAQRVSKVLPPSTELVVCLPSLTDMGAADFAALVRLHPLLGYMPLLAIIAEQGQEIALKQSGFNAVLIRPFTAVMLQRILAHMGREARATRTELIASLRREGAVPNHQAFDRKLQEYIPPDRATMTAEDSYRIGRELTRERRWDEALPYLQKAAADGATQAEACLTLAALWKARGEKGKIRTCLLGALQGFLEKGAWGKADALTRHIAAEYPDQPNPLLRELERCVRTGRRGDLPDLAGLALEYVTEAELIDTLLKACTAASDAESSLNSVLDALRGDEWSDLTKALARAAGGDAGPATKRRGWLRRALGLARRTPPSKKADAVTGDLPESMPDEFPDEPEVFSSSADKPDLADLNVYPPTGKPTGPVIVPLDQGTDELRPSRLPGPLGDALTVIRGTRRLYRSAK